MIYFLFFEYLNSILILMKAIIFVLRKSSSVVIIWHFFFVYEFDVQYTNKVLKII